MRCFKLPGRRVMTCDFDGQVVDRYGLHWLIGFEGDDAA